MSRWIRRWDGVISMGWLIVTIAIFLFYGGSFVPQLFGKPDQILRLLVKLCMLVLLSTHYIFVLCSKIRSLFKAATPRLCWATTLNVRYLIKRAQFLDMPSRGQYTDDNPFIRKRMNTSYSRIVISISQFQ